MASTGTRVGVIGPGEPGQVQGFAAGSDAELFLELFGLVNVIDGDYPAVLAELLSDALCSAEVVVVLQLTADEELAAGSLFEQNPAVEAGRVVRLGIDESFSLYPHALRIEISLAAVRTIADAARA